MTFAKPQRPSLAIKPARNARLDPFDARDFAASNLVTEKVIYTMILIIASPDNQSSSDTRSGGGGDGGRGTRGAVSPFFTTSPDGARGVGTGSGRFVSATVSPLGGAENEKSFHALFDRNLLISSSSPAKDAVCLDIRASREV